jgi:hypothetical protein
MTVARSRSRWAAVAILTCGCALGEAALGARDAAAQDPFESPDTEPRRAARATRIEGAAPRVDGRLDDEVWRSAEFTSGFTQKDPNEGAPSLDDTRVAFLYDAAALYIGARMACEDPQKIRSTLARRDESGNSERIIVSLDTYHDRRTAYTFAVTASGVRIDYYHPIDHEFERDYSFDPVWEAHTAIDSAGWTAEMRIPLSQLRFNAGERQTWGLNMNRWTPTRNEDSYWAMIPKAVAGWSSRFGDLAGLDGIEPARRLELFPYVASDARFSTLGDDGDPFADESRYASRAGGDVKMGIGPSLTLEGTVNPDFGQVEADPAEVNLTAFETFFPERRPFFTEGSQLLQGYGPSHFYSRRIGAAPRGEANGDYVDVPNTTTILGAAKLSGRLGQNTSLGALAALTAREYAETYDATSGAFGQEEVAPVAGFGVLRLQRQFGGQGSTAALSFAGVRRDVSPGAPLAGTFNRQAYSGGVAWRLFFGRSQYLLGGNVNGSVVEGDSTAIAGVQTASARYFQRPDAPHVELDSSRTSLAGYTTGLFLEKLGGKHWLWGSGFNAESPGFEINDTGRLSNSDDMDSWAFLKYRETRPGSLFRQYDIQLLPNAGWNFGGQRQYSGVDLETNWTWKNFMRTFLGYGFYSHAQNDNFTRGGPVMEDPDTWLLNFGLYSNFAANTQWEFFEHYSHDATCAWGSHFTASFTVRPAGRWKISLGPVYDHSYLTRQYFDTLAGGPPETYGSRYVFAHIERSTISAQARVNYAFSPDLTLEVYAEPFVASGDYSNHGELLAAGTTDILTYGTGGTTVVPDADGNLNVTEGPDSFTLENSDFNYFSFRSNVVLRWEWRRGSTFYFVWQQNREEEETSDRLIRPGDIWDSFSADGENFLAVKLSYWLPVN